MLVVGAIIYLVTSRLHKARGRDLGQVFATLPKEAEEPEGAEVE